MKEEEKIIERYGRKGPWRMPDGYLDSVCVDVLAALPEFPVVPQPVKMSRWQRVKPYVYLAAMFGGIWCMMQMFHHAAGNSQLNLDNPPAHIAALMSESDMGDMLSLPTLESDMELIDEVSAEYSSIEDFQKDFGVDIKPQYDKIEL